MRHIRYANSLGMYPLAKDDVRGGRAKTRWARAFVRACYDQHKWWSGGPGEGWRLRKRTVAREAQGLRFEVGRAVPARGVIPAGRAVRVMLAEGGAAKARAVAKIPAEQIWANGGPAWADPERRDWA